MATSKRSTSSWSRRGGRHGGSNGNGLKYAENSKVEKVEFSKGQHPKCLCDLYAIISISKTPENSGRLFFLDAHYIRKNYRIASSLHGLINYLTSIWIMIVWRMLQWIFVRLLVMFHICLLLTLLVWSIK
ncbi:uncharacterized protein DS421_6g197040 [Arachis hypogaea]|nr:uncharacterized protein DS421_6g197040 [Arachis hypogaea]